MQKVLFLFLLAISVGAVSCSGPQKAVYFKDANPNDPKVITQQIDKFKEAIIQPDDILSIHLSSESSIAEPGKSGGIVTAVFNDGGAIYGGASSAGSAGGATSSGGGKGYLVDHLGFIDYPVLGKVRVAGYTIRQVKDMLVQTLKNYVKDPVVEVNIINYKITVLGEVGRAGTITAANHKISILDAIAAAGDIPISGRKDNVLVIRETEGVREFARLNLNSRQVFSSPYFYLKQNDVVIVEPGKQRKQEGNNFFRFYLPAISSIMSTLLALYGIVQLTIK